MIPREPNRIGSSGRYGSDPFMLDQRIRSVLRAPYRTALDRNPNCNLTDSRLLADCRAGIGRPGRVGPARALGKLSWSVARSPSASGGTRRTRSGWTSVRRRIRAPDRGCSSSLLGFLPCSWLLVALLEETVKSDRSEFPQEMRSTLDRLWKRGTLPQRAGQSPQPARVFRF